jgi:hypothetical protein
MSTRGNQLRTIRSILYRLKRAYGQPLSVVYQTQSAVDLATGAKTVARGSVDIVRAIALPTLVQRDFKYDIGYLKANSNFTYGGLYLEGGRDFIVEARDLPAGFEIKASDQMFLVFQGKHYTIKKVEQVETLAFFVTAQYTAGAPAYAVVHATAFDRLGFTESFAGGT